MSTRRGWWNSWQIEALFVSLFIGIAATSHQPFVMIGFGFAAGVKFAHVLMIVLEEHL